MATTGYTSTGAWYDTGLGLCRLHGDIVYNWSRSNNTVTFSSTYCRIKHVRETGTWASYTYTPGWNWRLFVGTSTQRSSNSASGTRSVNQVENGSSVSFSVSVTASQTTYSARVGAYFSPDSMTYTSTKTLSFGAAGAPTGSTASATNVKSTTATLGASVTTWGNYCTAGTGQRIEYKKHSDSTWTTLAYSTSASHTRAVTGLQPGTVYDVRTYAKNGAGLTATSSTITFETQSSVKLITESGVEDRIVNKISPEGVVTECIVTKIV